MSVHSVHHVFAHVIKWASDEGGWLAIVLLLGGLAVGEWVAPDPRCAEQIPEQCSIVGLGGLPHESATAVHFGIVVLCGLVGAVIGIVLVDVNNRSNEG